MTARPWESGDEHARWDGYLLADGRTLRNRVGATTPEMLREREDRRVEARALKRGPLICAERRRWTRPPELSVDW